MTITSSTTSPRAPMRFRKFASLGLMASIVVMSLTAPAHASHTDHSPAVSFGKARFTIRIESSSAPDRKSYAKREYERGMAQGRCDGEGEGWRDGFDGRCFDSNPDLCFDRESRHFARGYAEGFQCAYAAAFERGQCARAERNSRGHGRDRGRHHRRW